MGKIERHDPRFDAIIAADAVIEKLAEGFAWSEGPVWDQPHGYLLFSDVPANKVMKWREGDGVSLFLSSAGHTSSVPSASPQPGSNGLLFDGQGRLVLCQHGDRRVARLESDGSFTTLAHRYKGKRLNSPNDAVLSRKGDLYFTDPPYGLKGLDKDPGNELGFSGVYRVSAEGAISLLIDDLPHPNGVALSPDEKTLYVAHSDPQRAIWLALELTDEGKVATRRIFADATPAVRSGKKGLPDGLKVDRQGNLFATGPAGVLIFAPDGTCLGTIATGEFTANCAWGDDGHVLYMTADKAICRIRTLTRGLTSW